MYNRFAKMRHRYLREHRNGIYTGMFLDGKLEAHLKEIGDAAIFYHYRVAVVNTAFQKNKSRSPRQVASYCFMTVG